jgi:hypothetical protein
MRPTTVARTVKSPVFSPARRAGAVATPELLVTTVATFSPPVKVAFVSPRIVKRTRTFGTALPASVSVRAAILSVKASPAIAESLPVPAFSRWCTVSVGVGLGGVLDGGGVLGGGGLDDGGGVGLGDSPGGVGLEPGGVVPGVLGDVLGLVPLVSSLRLPGSVPVPSGTSWVPLR